MEKKWEHTFENKRSRDPWVRFANKFTVWRPPLSRLINYLRKRATLTKRKIWLERQRPNAIIVTTRNIRAFGPR